METILGHPLPSHRSQLGGALFVRALRTGDRIGYTLTTMSRQTGLGFPSQKQVTAMLRGLAAYPWRSVPVQGYPLHQVLICLGEAEDGRMICTGVLINPKKHLEIPSRLLRDIRLGEVVTLAAVINRHFLPVGTVKRSTRRRARPGPTGYPDSFYRGVADEYALALKTYPRTPIRRLMTVYSGASEATIHRYLKRCRELGLLKPRTTKGRTS
jgi:hypothetical protein